MFEVNVIAGFAGAHHLRDYKGKCENLHGHNWKVEVTLFSKTLDKTGMVFDFTDLKKIINGVIEIFDHKYLNNIPPFNKINPTSENMAKYINEKVKTNIKKSFPKLKIEKIRTTVWESDRQWAAYTA